MLVGCVLELFVFFYEDILLALEKQSKGREGSPLGSPIVD